MGSTRAAVAVGLGVGNALRARGNLALSGDQRAIAAFMRRSARWSSPRRVRVAKKLQADLTRTLAQKARQCSRRGKGPSNRLLVREAKLKLKLGALVALEVEAKKNPNQQLVAGDPQSVPFRADRDPEADEDQADDVLDPPEFSALDLDDRVLGLPVPMLLGALVLGVIVLAASRHATPTPRQSRSTA